MTAKFSTQGVAAGDTQLETSSRGTRADEHRRQLACDLNVESMQDVPHMSPFPIRSGVR